MWRFGFVSLKELECISRVRDQGQNGSLTEIDLVGEGLDVLGRRLAVVVLLLEIVDHLLALSVVIPEPEVRVRSRDRGIEERLFHASPILALDHAVLHLVGHPRRRPRKRAHRPHARRSPADHALAQRLARPSPAFCFPGRSRFQDMPGRGSERQFYGFFSPR